MAGLARQSHRRLGLVVRCDQLALWHTKKTCLFVRSLREFICGVPSCFTQRENTAREVWFSSLAMCVEVATSPVVYRFIRPVAKCCVVVVVVEKRPEPK